MSIKNLQSWKLSQSEPFYPISLKCIGSGDECAISTYSHHTINTFIFRNFTEAIKNDRAPHKCYLQPSLYPDSIQDIAVGNSESVVLFDNGQLKYFFSPKKLKAVSYLANVKTICCCKNGFALVKLSDDATKIFIEIHPDAFNANSQIEMHGRQTYDISFDQILPIRSTFRQTSFKIKEFRINNPGDNQFLNKIFPEVFIAEWTKNHEFLFLGIDNSFCSLHLIDGEYVVNPIVVCGTNILDFWCGNNNDHMLLLLDSGIMEILYLNDESNGIAQQNLYFGSEINAYVFHDDFFVYANTFNVTYGSVEFRANTRKFKFNRKTLELAGIAAMTFLPDHHSVLCVSENRQFYTIDTQKKQTAENDNNEWFEVNEKTKSQLVDVKYELIELNESYENLLERQKHHHRMIDIVNMKQNDLKLVGNRNGSDIEKFRFIATCTVTRSPPIQTQNIDLFTNIVNISNSLVYDQNKSFFVSIKLTTVIHANEFDEPNLWHLRCRWLNDRRENEYANIRITAGMLSQPLTVNLHLQQQQLLPYFELDISTMIPHYGSKAAVMINFPVNTEQPNYCDMMQGITLSDEPNLDDALICTLFIPKKISLDVAFRDKLVEDKRSITKSSHINNAKTIYKFYLLEKALAAVHYPLKQVLQVKTNDAEFMNAFKMFVQRAIEAQLSATGEVLDVRVTNDCLKEYCVSDVLIWFLIELIYLYIWRL